MIRINLLKSEQRDAPKTLEPAADSVQREKKRLNLSFNYNLIFLLAIVLIGVLFLSQNTALKKERQLRQDAQNQKAKLKNVAQKLTRVQQQKTLYQQKIALIKDLKSRQGAAVWIMEEISRNLPNWVWLTEASFQENSVRIKGRAINNNLIAQYIEQLENSSYFANVALNNSTQKSAGRTKYYEFTIRGRFINFQAPAEPATQEGEED